MTITADLQSLVNRIEPSSAARNSLLANGLESQIATTILAKLDTLKADLSGIQLLYGAFFESINFIDSCASSSNKIQCYRDELENYGVSISDDPDFVFNSPDAERQLGILLAAVYTVAYRLGVYKTLLPTEAFQRVMGPIEFRYNDDPNEVYRLAEVPNDISGVRQPAFVTLVAASFNPGSTLGENFIVVHELGHVFHNRDGNATGNGIYGTDRIVYDYVDGTDAD